MATEEHTRVIALLPSLGLSGGIESYARAVIEALEQSGARVRTLHLADAAGRPSIRAKMSFALAALSSSRDARRKGPVIIIAFHRGFNLLASMAARATGRETEAYVICHGWEVWNLHPIKDLASARSRARSVAVSTYTAGSLVRSGEVRVLPPGIPADRYERLVRLRSTDSTRTLRLLSVFVLRQFSNKGGPSLVEACETLRSQGTEVHLTIAGRGPVPDALATAAQARGWMRVIESPSDDALDSLYLQADVFVLASRTRVTRGEQSGEGFGIVLAEAALAGLPVVAPAFGGSSEAYLDGITGLHPRDETPTALAATLRWIRDHPAESARMGANGRVWAAARFSPDSYRAAVCSLFLGDAATVAHRLNITAEAQP
jgi:glycosyltransferase involved in cell wall biosynthesis